MVDSLKQRQASIMATHFVCQSTEPLQHQFPSGLGGKTHGAVSQYEGYNAINKAHTQFPPPGWDFSLTSEEDSLPLLKSAPQSWRDSSFHPDPDLCLTPLKKPDPPGKSSLPKRKPAQKTEVNPDPLLALTPDKRHGSYQSEEIGAFKTQGRKPKVRFDIQSQSETSGDEGQDYMVTDNLKSHSPVRKSYDKPYQPEIYGNDSDNEDVMLEKAKAALGLSENSRRVGYTVGKYSQEQGNDCTEDTEETVSDNEESLAYEYSKKTYSLPETNSVSVRRKTDQVFSEHSKSKKDSVESDADPIAACRATQPTASKRRVKVLRESRPGPATSEYTFPFNSDPSEFAGGAEHMFARPEYNSTLRMKLAAERMKESEVDIETALHKKLNVSDGTRTEISEKAASHVNAGGPMFSGLVSLALPTAEICKDAVELKTVRAKQTVPAKSKNKSQREPDLMEFFTADRQKESVSYSLSSLPARRQCLATASNWRAFDLYKHNRVWESRGTKQ